EFRNQGLESFCDEKGISQNFSSPNTPEQNGVAERKIRTLIEAARTMLNGSVLSKHFWTKVRERILDINYFRVFGCLVFIHNQKDHLGKIDVKAEDGYFLGYSFISKAFRVFNTRRKQVEETYHVTVDESMEAIMFTNALVDEIGINDSSRYPPNEYIHKDDLSRQYQVNFDISYYITPHNRLLTKLTKTTHVPKVITPTEQNTPFIEDTEGPPDLINTKGTHKQIVQNEQNNNQPSKEHSRNNTKTTISITIISIPEIT
ncbi:retrovirus-related pol polyprotein from transposon TNT 1-94, partial [Tanacetum coccineum]